MPTLENPRHEAFAQARARGAFLIDAYEAAGYVRHRGHPGRLAVREEVAERIAELRALQTDIEDVSPIGLLASLRRIIKAGEGSENPTLVNAARLAILDASRIQAEMDNRYDYENKHLVHVFKTVQEEAAKAAAASPPPQPPQAPPREAPAAAPPAPIQRPSSAHGAPAKLLSSAAASPLARPGELPKGCPASPRRRPRGAGPLAPREPQEPRAHGHGRHRQADNEADPDAQAPQMKPEGQPEADRRADQPIAAAGQHQGMRASFIPRSTRAPTTCRPSNSWNAAPAFRNRADRATTSMSSRAPAPR